MSEPSAPWVARIDPALPLRKYQVGELGRLFERPSNPDKIDDGWYDVASARERDVLSKIRIQAANINSPLVFQIMTREEWRQVIMEERARAARGTTDAAKFVNEPDIRVTALERQNAELQEQLSQIASVLAKLVGNGAAGVVAPPVSAAPNQAPSFAGMEPNGASTATATAMVSDAETFTASAQEVSAPPAQPVAAVPTAPVRVGQRPPDAVKAGARPQAASAAKPGPRAGRPSVGEDLAEKLRAEGKIGPVSDDLSSASDGEVSDQGA